MRVAIMLELADDDAKQFIKGKAKINSPTLYYLSHDEVPYEYYVQKISWSYDSDAREFAKTL